MRVCPRCIGSRKIKHKRLGVIACPLCSHGKRLDPSGLKQVSEDDAARRAQTIEEPRKATGHDTVRSLLALWGRLVRDRGIGYPSMSTTEKARIGRGGGSDFAPKLPPDIEALDQAISRANEILSARNDRVTVKALLGEHYTKSGRAADKAAHLGISRTWYFTAKAKAEMHIATAIGV